MRAQNIFKSIESGEYMKIKTKICILGVMLAGVCALDAARKTGSEAVFDKFVEPIVVGSNYLDLKGEASIDIAVLINEEGIVDDWLTLRTNDRLLISAIGNVIGDWRFKPTIRNGEPSWSYTEFQIVFRKSGTIVNMGIPESVMGFFHTFTDDFQLTVPFRELDSIPKPISMETPTLHSSLFRNNIGKKVKFEFFIDRDGNVRMPIVKESTTENTATAIILESLLKWKFEPPTKNGVRVATKAVIPFDVK